MQILIRRIRRDAKGTEELSEETHGEAVVTVGQRNDRVIQLLDPAVAGEHLVLRAGPRGRFGFKTASGESVSVGGKSKRRGTLAPGQSIRVGEQTLTVIEAPPGFDAALELHLTEAAGGQGLGTRFRTTLEQTGLGTRKLGWALLLGIVALFLALPLAGLQWPGLAEWSRDRAWVPSDNQWISGPLANAHHTPEIGTDCNTCHLQAFEMAPDRGCVQCHGRMRAHVRHAEMDVPRLTGMRCASCHKEHNEPANLVRSDAKLCVECHRDLDAVARVTGAAELAQPVAGFSERAHPPFRLALLRQSDNGMQWHRERVANSDGAPEERSHLAFPHDIHLDPEKAGETLECQSCHRLKDDGEHFEPITMERDCRECHALAFDDDLPRKQLPHGEASAVVVALEEHFIRKLSDPSLGGSDRRRRRPGRRRGDEPTCEGSALECGRQRAAQEAETQFTRSGCVTCHQVKGQPERPLVERWRVQEVRLTGDWYPYARFDHEVHLTRSREKLGDEAACVSCHRAKTSTTSKDVLIPGRDSCLECHGPSDTGTGTRAELTCRDCHGFHLPFREFMTAGRRRNP